jgi:RNA polymerase II-associated factor 1
MSSRSKPSVAKAGPARSGETDADRVRRRAEKQRRVGEHRQAILQKVNPQQARVKLHKKEDLICPVEFTNTLPALPLDPKLMIFPFDDDFLTAFDVTNGVSADAAVPFELHSQANLGLQINLIDPAAYDAPPASARPPLDPADAEIMSEAYAKPATRGGAGGLPDEERLSVEWLMQSSLMHLDLFDSVYKHADVNETANASLASKKAAMDNAYSGSRADRIAVSFAARDEPLRHPVRPDLAPRRVWEVLPDATRSAVGYVQVR